MKTEISKTITIFLLCLTTMVSTVVGADDMQKYKKIAGYVVPGPDEVHIGPTSIGMPLRKILLIRKDSIYCSVIFTKFWTGKNFTKIWIEEYGKEKFANYDVYYQKDGTGDFNNKNVKFSTEKASLLEPRGVFFPLIWQPGKPDIKCGPLRLIWDPYSDVCHVGFIERGDPDGDYGIELAPTPWTSITEVDVFDPRVKWYKYDTKRKRINVHADHLWDDTEMKKKK